MSSFFGKLRANATGSNPGTGFSPGKKDQQQHVPTPLEKLLHDAGPIRDDGSDKFFGMENFGNTCYCNSILQCLYYSIPFREQVISYPKRSPLDSLSTTVAGLPRINTTTTGINGQAALSPSKPKTPAGATSARNPGGPTPPQKPEDKDSPEYKKKQAMLTGPLLAMNYDNSESYGMSESLFTSLKDIFEALIANKSRTGVVSPAKFLEVLRRENEMFRTSMHQDAHEFLNLLLNEVVANVETNSRKLEAEKAVTNGTHGDVERALVAETPNTTGTRSPTNTGWVHELFEGTLTSETKCLTCENVSQRDEAFLDLSVDLDQHSSVTSCLRKFSEEEMLCERNKFHCDRCGGLQEAEKRMKIKRLPKILALHLKRFKYTEDLQRLQKLFHRVVYPYHLRLFNTTDDAEDPDRLYELYAVVVHIGGGPYHGHYVSIIKTQDRGWLLFDDEMVEPVDKSYVRNFFGERPGLACAYVLFYQETTLEAVKKEQEADALAAASQSTTAPVSKDPRGLGITVKTNGIHANGPDLTSPLSATATTDPESAAFDKTPLSPTVTSTTATTATTATAATTVSSPVQPLSTKKSDGFFRKDRNKEEKERIAAEKEAEKEAEKTRRMQMKSLDLKRRDTEKKQLADLRAANEASKHSAAATIAGKENGGAIAVPAEPKPAEPKSAVERTTSTLNRFRQSSKSLSKKPKFWGSSSKEKDVSKELALLAKENVGKDESAIEDDDGSGPVTKPDTAAPPTPGLSHSLTHGASGTPDVKRNRFSLRRKTSTLT